MVAEDAVAWLGAGSGVIDFAKDDFRTGVYNNAKAAWYRWVAPVAQMSNPTVLSHPNPSRLSR